MTRERLTLLILLGAAFLAYLFAADREPVS